MKSSNNISPVRSKYGGRVQTPSPPKSSKYESPYSRHRSPTPVRSSRYLQSPSPPRNKHSSPQRLVLLILSLRSRTFFCLILAHKMRYIKLELVFVLVLKITVLLMPFILKYLFFYYYLTLGL